MAHKKRKEPAGRCIKNTNDGGITSQDKFNIVVETATTNEAELSAYGRRKGLYPEQIASWRQLCLNPNKPMPTKTNQAAIRRQTQENK